MAATPPRSDFALMLMADARLPAGGHTQSAGLEAALAGGMAVSDIYDYIVVRLRTTATVEAGTAVATLTVLGAGCDHEVTAGRLADVQQHWAARTPSQVQRHASSTLARGYLRLLRTLFPGHATTALVEGLASPCRPVTVGALAHVLALGQAQLVRLICYDEVQSITSAALKLAPLDPVTTVRWALATRPVVEDVVHQIAVVRDVADLPAPAAPLIERWVHAHASQNSRLFSA